MGTWNCEDMELWGRGIEETQCIASLQCSPEKSIRYALIAFQTITFQHFSPTLTI